MTTSAGTALYALSDFGTRSKILYVHNETRNIEVLRDALQNIRQSNLESDSAQGPVLSYAVDGLDANGDAQLRLYRTPDSVQTISVYTVRRTNDLSTDADSVTVPTSPIIQWAYSYALRERGETGGQSSAEQAIFAQQELSNAVSFDAGLSPDETIWTTV